MKMTTVLSIPLLLSGFVYAQQSVASAFPYPDNVIENYTNQVTNTRPYELKKITIINNSANIIYPVARVYNTEDKHEYRIYVGYLEGKEQHYGILPKQKAVISLPRQLWNAGRVELFTKMPEIPAAPKVKNPISAIDEIPNSSNKGDLIYRNDTALGFPLDARSQLAEYTIETNQDGSDRHVVDYDISYVDEMYLPMAVEVDLGTMGYMGNGMSVEELQKELKTFFDGGYTRDYFEKNLGWPGFNLEGDAQHYDAGYIKIPGAYNIIALKDSRSSFEQSKFMLTSNLFPNDSDKTAIKSIVNRWFNWMPSADGAPTKLCEKDANPVFCQSFAETVHYVIDSVKEKFPALTPEQIVEKLLGYDFDAKFNPYDPKIDPPKFNQPNAFRDSVKSLLRGVPYPFWNYDEASWYPNPSAVVEGGEVNLKQKYNLDPLVWFVHKKLNMSGYGFSIDDDTANVEAPGNGFIIAVGGLEGLLNKSPYQANTQQAVLFAPGWTGLKADHLGECLLNKNNGTNCPVSLNPEAFKSATVTLEAENSQENTLTFSLQYGEKNSKGVYPLILTPSSCQVKGKLDPNLCNIVKNDPDKPQFFIIPPPM